MQFAKRSRLVIALCVAFVACLATSGVIYAAPPAAHRAARRHAAHHAAAHHAAHHAAAHHSAHHAAEHHAETVHKNNSSK